MCFFTYMPHIYMKTYVEVLKEQFCLTASEPSASQCPCWEEKQLNLGFLPK